MKRHLDENVEYLKGDGIGEARVGGYPDQDAGHEDADDGQQVEGVRCNNQLWRPRFEKG
jgi:hypothetical protein